MKTKHLAAILSLAASIAVFSRFGAIWGLVAYAALSLVLAPRESVCFVNNFGILQNTILVADAFSQFLEALVPFKNMVLDVQDEKSGARVGKPGEVITVKDWRSTVTPYQPAPTYAPQNVDTSAGDRQVTLPLLPWACSFTLTAAEFRILATGATGGADYVMFKNKISNLMINGIGKKLMDLWFATITTANYPDSPCKTINAVGNMNRAVEIDLDTVLFGRNVPSDGAQIICNPTFYGEWAKDHIAIQTYNAVNAQARLLVSGGVQSQNSNFTFWRTNRTMPTNAARAFACGRTGVIAAFRAPDEPTFPGDPVSLDLITHQDLGIPMLARLWKNAADGSIQFDIATLPVFAKGQTEAIQRVEII